MVGLLIKYVFGVEYRTRRICILDLSLFVVEKCLHIFARLGASGERCSYTRIHCPQPSWHLTETRKNTGFSVDPDDMLSELYRTRISLLQQSLMWLIWLMSCHRQQTTRLHSFSSLLHYCFRLPPAKPEARFPHFPLQTYFATVLLPLWLCKCNDL